jgi:hypothetical protein
MQILLSQRTFFHVFSEMSCRSVHLLSHLLTASEVCYDIVQRFLTHNAVSLPTLARKPADNLYTYPDVKPMVNTNTKCL